MTQWHRIAVMDQGRLNYEVYQWSVNNGNFRNQNWAYRIKLRPKKIPVFPLTYRFCFFFFFFFLCQPCNFYCLPEKNKTDFHTYRP